MDNIRKFFFKALCTACCAAVLQSAVLPTQAWSMYIPKKAPRETHIVMIRRILESKGVRLCLGEMGLTLNAALTGIDHFSDEQLHRFASRLDPATAEAGALDALIILLLAMVLATGVTGMSGHFCQENIGTDGCSED